MPKPLMGEVNDFNSQGGLDPQVAAAQPAQPRQAAPKEDPYRFMQPISAENLKMEDGNIGNDLNNGYIKPQTYSDLFAKKDTLGKIGTLFGLMVSGAGAGLSHQPNALLELMNKEIERDMEAQKTNQGASQNYVKLRQQEDLNKAQIANYQKQGLLTDAQARLAVSNADINDNSLRRIQLNRIALHDLIDKANKLPPNSPERAAADQTIAMISSQVQNENYDIADRAAAQSKLLHASFIQDEDKELAKDGTQAPAMDKGVDLKKMQNLINVGKMNPNLPGVIPQAEVAQITKEAQEVADNRAVAKAYDKAFKKLNDSFLAGKLNPNARSAIITTLAADISRDTTGRFNKDENAVQAESLFPSVSDFGGAAKEKYYNFMQTLAHKEDGAVTLDRYKLKSPFPNYQLEGKKKETAPGTDTVARNTSDGRVAIFDRKTKKFLRYDDDTQVAGD